MDRRLEGNIRSAAELGRSANCITELLPDEIWALLDEIDRLREKLNLLRHVLEHVIEDCAEAKEHTEYGEHADDAGNEHISQSTKQQAQDLLTPSEYRRFMGYANDNKEDVS